MSKLLENETMTEKHENKFTNILTDSFSLHESTQMIFTFFFGHVMLSKSLTMIIYYTFMPRKRSGDSTALLSSLQKPHNKNPLPHHIPTKVTA